MDPSSAIERTATAPAGKQFVVINKFKAYNGASGKYYSGNTYLVDSGIPLYDLFDEIRTQLCTSDEFFYYATFPGHIHDHPHLFCPQFVKAASRIKFEEWK